MHINYYHSNGIKYAKVCDSIRNGTRVTKKVVRYLGRVIDEDKGIYKNKDDGLFSYTLETNEIKKVDPEYQPPPIVRKNAPLRRRTLGLTFGDAFLISEFIKKVGLQPVIDAIGYKNRDTLFSTIIYYITENSSNACAMDWWEESYASVLYPNAKMESQRISEMLEDIGEEEAKRNFFAAYFDYLKENKVTNPRKLKMVVDDGILIDSTGLPNVSKLPCTAVSNHNGVVSEEVRLIYVVQQSTGLPLFYRYVPGNVIDSSTIKKTIKELKLNGINTAWALLDAGYYNGQSADALHDAHISFVTRAWKNHKIFTESLEKYSKELLSDDNRYIYEKRLYYIKEIKCSIGTKKNIPAYAYLCYDEEMGHAQRKSELLNLDNGKVDKETDANLKNLGFFMLISSRRIAREKLLSLYFTRDQIEKIFEIVKQYTNGLPIRVQKDTTFRGHLLLTFVATIVYKLLADELYDTGYTVENVLKSAQRLQCLIYDKELFVNEMRKQLSVPLKILKIKVPESIPYSQKDSDN